MTPAETTFADFGAWISLLALLVSFAGTLWAIFSGPARKNADATKAIDARLHVVEASHDRLRDRVDRLPDADQMHRLELTLARMEGHIDRLDERLKPVAAISERMQEILIEQGRK
jgi:Protein of unknown function (DUF2730)